VEAARVLSAPPLPRAAALLGALWSILAPLGPASAQEGTPPRLTVIGVGAGVMCDEWLVTTGADPELERWAFGFAGAVDASAQLRQGGDPLARLDADAIHAWLGDRCRRRPEGPLSVALVRMVLAAPR